jgi:hypothetical protein
MEYQYLLSKEYINISRKESIDLFETRGIVFIINTGHLFGISYSGVSHAVESIKLKQSKSRQLQTQFEQFNLLFKL